MNTNKTRPLPAAPQPTPLADLTSGTTGQIINLAVLGLAIYGGYKLVTKK
jgi:hypothetical protein